MWITAAIRCAWMFLLAMPPAAAPSRAPVAGDTSAVRANDLRRAAGTVRADTLRVVLVARHGVWHPDREDGPGLIVDALGEGDDAPSVPGPLIRVRFGTPVHVTVRNTLADTMSFYGLAAVMDTLHPLRIPPGESRDARFLPSAPGTHVYEADLGHDSATHYGGIGGQMMGAVIVDTAGAPPERVMLLTAWQMLVDSTKPKDGERIFWAINGRMWPHTERLTYTVGDTVRWRIIDGTADVHPMHLHGFFFRVDSRGDMYRDTAYDAAHRRWAVTEGTLPLGNFALTWVPERPGHWLFHCHKAFHISRWTRDQMEARPLGAAVTYGAGAMTHMNDMAGLVMGIEVRPRPGAAPVAADAADRPGDRRIRLTMRARAKYFRDSAAYVYGLDARGPGAPAVPAFPGPPIVLTRGRRAVITVVNYLPVPSAVHWHGMELESFYDGVPGWSGDGTRPAPVIAPGDSFVARITPPRAGSFMYHTHVDDYTQLSNGLYGPLVVLDPGEVWDPSRDHVLFFGRGGSDDSSTVVLNGSAKPDTLLLDGRGAHRLRFMDMAPEDVVHVELLSADSTVARWRPIAKDGGTLPPALAVDGPARLSIAPGETWDVMVHLAPGVWILRSTADATIRLPVRVR